MNSLHTWLCSLCIASVCSPCIGAEPQSEQQLKDAEKLRAVVDFLESELEIANDLLKRQAGSSAEVDLARADLAKARHDLALAENDTDEVIAQCQQLIEVRSRQLQRQEAMGRLGFGSSQRLAEAGRRLACSRFQLAQLQAKPGESLAQLKLIVQFCNEELAYLTKQQADGTVSMMELNRARHRATIAEHRLAKITGDSQSVLPKLRRSVELGRQEVEQINRLLQQGYADMLDQYSARSHLFNAQLLLANLEKDHAAARKQLDDLIRNHEQILPRLGDDRKERLARLEIERELERDRTRRAQHQRDGFLADDLSVAELGF